MTILASSAEAFTGEATGDFGSDWLDYERCAGLDYTMDQDVDAGIVVVSFDQPEDSLCEGIFGEGCGDRGPVYTVEGLDFSTGDPVLVRITLEDQNGEVFVYDLWSLLEIEPQPPTVSLSSSPRHTVVTVNAQARTQAITSDMAEAFQIQRYLGNEDTAEIWVDWSPFDESSDDHLNIPVPPGLTIGYRIRWRAPDGHVSPWSTWVTIAT